MKRYPALLLVLALLFLCLFSGASADQEGDLAYGDLVYRLQPDGTVVITGCTGKNGDLSIPAKIAGAPVTAIAPEAFKSNSALSRVELPDSLVEIGDYAFFYCRNLSFINLPDSVRVVGRNPFAACEVLSEIHISKNHPYLTLQDNVLYSLEDRRLVACYRG